MKIKEINWRLLIVLFFLVIFWITVIILTVKIFPASAAVNLDFQYSENRAKSKTQDMFYSLDGRFRRDDVEFKTNNKFKNSKVNEETDNSRQFHEFQINNYYSNLYIFFNGQFLADTALGIVDSYSYGWGCGYKTKIFETQAGIYGTNDAEPNIKGFMDILYPFKKLKNLEIEMDTSGEINTGHMRDFSVQNVSSFNMVLNDRMKFKIGHEINFTNRNFENNINTTKRLFSGLNYNF